MGIEAVANNPVQVTKSLVLANTEYYVLVPVGVKQITFKARQGGADLRFSWTQGKVATGTDEPHLTLNPGGAYNLFNARIERSYKLYFASSIAGTILECEFWR